MSFTAWAPHARARKETDKPIPEDASTMTSRRSLLFSMVATVPTACYSYEVSLAISSHCIVG